MKRRFTLLAIATFVSTSLMAAWDGTTTAPTGTGTASDPYLIATPENLAWIASDAGDLTKVYKQTADLDLGNNSWTPIGKSGKPFSGTYDGGGYVINNLYYSNPTGTNVGLFGYISGATLTRISIGSGNLSGSGSIAGICGAAYANSTISYCSNNATIFARKEQNGGICGYLEKSKVTDCINYGLISGYNMTGGIVGRCKNGTNDKIYNCINAGQVFSMCATSGNILGLCDGSVPADIQNCYYDNQINTLGAFTKSKSERYTIDDVENEYKGISTAMLTNGSALTGYVTEKWAFNNGLYPQLKNNSENIAIIVAATPVILSSNDKADNVTTDFNVSTVSNLTWNSGESANIAFSNGKATILKSTGVVVVGSKTDKGVTYTKKVYLKTNKQGATALGSKDSPLTIESEAELKAFREAVNTYGTYKHCSAYDGFKGIHFKVTVDITLSALYLTNYEPIGIHNSFKGVFDGNHRSINNVDANLSSLPFVSGLFGGASYGEIKNISVSCGDGKKIAGKQYVGGICGAIFEETIDNCTSNCTIELGSNSHAGGIVGTDKGFSTIKDCENSGSISGGGYIAGIMGLSNISTTFIGCKNTGTISGESNNIGGICACVAFVSGNCVINNCENHGTISTAEDKTNIGGIIGYIPANATEDIVISNCINSGDIIINGIDAKYIGGIVGHSSKTLTITNCLNIGQIKGHSSVGGIIGFNESTLTITNAFNAGEITGTAVASSGTCTNCINVGNAETSPNCIYDAQMCPVGSTGKLTADMLGTELQSSLNSTDWTFTTGMYPMIKALENSDYMIVAATPIILNSSETPETIDGVSKTFDYGKANGVEWECNKVNEERLVSFVNGKGYIANPDANTDVILTANKGDAAKKIPVTIKTKGLLTDPELHWTLTPSVINYGDPITAEMLNATKESACTGEWIYSVKKDSILHASDNHILTATFIPDDQQTYAIKTIWVTLKVNKGDAKNFITWNPTKNITYGDEDSDGAIKNATATIEGKFYYNIPALTVGTHTVKLEFNGTNYETKDDNPIKEDITVSAATPIIAWAAPAPITYGTALSDLQLGAVSGVEGTFSYCEVINNADVALPTDGILNAGTHTLKAIFDAESPNYKDGEFKTVELVVEKLKPEIAWKDDVTFEEITYGETLSADDFAATVAAEFNNKGNILYLENGTAIDIYGNLTAGTHTITAKFVPTDDNYDTNTATATVKVNKAPANVQWSENLDAITYGEKLSETQLCATSAADGVQFTYTVTINGNTISAMGAILPAGDERVINAVLPESDNYEGWNGYRTIKVNPSPTTITWDDPEDIFYGTLLSDEQLNATATAIINGETVTVDGVWTYEPGKNTKLNASDTPQELTVKFTSTDNNFQSVEETIAHIVVKKASPEIEWNDQQHLTYGASDEEIKNALENATAKFDGVTLTGDYAYTLPLTTDLQAGADNITAEVEFIPTGEDANNFESANAVISIVVDKADPTITWTPIVSEITYGTELSADQLNAETNGVGEIVYTDDDEDETVLANGSILYARTHTITATLPESSNYNEATITATIIVNQAETSIEWETPAPIAANTPISAAELNATANVDGNFAYTLNGEDAEGQTLGVGNYTITATFTPNSANYKGSTATITLQVVQAAAEITWATPEAITYGTAISSVQLNATSEIDGTFYYKPDNGAILPAGDTSISVIFVPDSPDYGRALDTVKLTVNKAELSVSVADVTVNKGDAIPEFVISYDGFVNGENENILTTAPTATCAATTAEAGEFDIVVSGGESNNYNITCTNGKLIVVEAVTPVITWADPAAITYGTLISADMLNATANVDGSFTYSVSVGDTLKPGTHKLIATFVPVNNTLTQNVYFITDTVTLTVNKANLTVSVADVTVNQGDEMPKFNIEYKGFVLDETIANLTAVPSAKVNATTDQAGTFDIVLSGGESANYNFEYKNGKLTVKAKEDTTAIADNEVKISVYPNPTADVAIVETDSDADFIYVFNMSGKLILTEANVGKTQIDLANEPQGTYFVKVGGKTIKLVKF